MRRVFVALVSTVVGLVALLGFKTHTPAAFALTGATTPDPATATPSASAGASATKTVTAKASKKTIIGTAVNTRYGLVQVQIMVQGKKILAVTASQLPNSDGQSAQISQYSAPLLAKEALAAQSGNINMVSGATFTSDGYIQSLQSAIDQM